MHQSMGVTYRQCDWNHTLVIDADRHWFQFVIGSGTYRRLDAFTRRQCDITILCMNERC